MLWCLFRVAVLSFVASRGLEKRKTAKNGSCTGRCFTFDSSASCQCDEVCPAFMDCCSDYTTLCLKPECENITCVNGGECEVDPETRKAKCKCPKGFGDLQCSSLRCTRLGRVCTQEASCSKQRCSCPNKGWGIFECARQNQLLCAVKLDPHATSFGGAVANVYWPCRYRLTRLTTKVLDPAAISPVSKPSFCSIEVMAFNQISPKSGKHFLSGVEIAVEINIGSQGASSAQATIAKFDMFGDGVAGNDNSGVRFNTVGTEVHHSLHNVTIDCVLDSVQNFAVLSIPRCQNFQLKFRPYNPHEDPGAQSLAPGVSIRVDNPHSGHHASHYSSYHVYGPDFKNPLAQYPNSLCGTKDDGTTLYTAAGLTNAQNLLLDLLQQQHVDQVSTFVENPGFHVLDVVDHPDQCAVAKETITKCYTEEERRLTISTCSELLSSRRYTRCMGPEAMITFRYCLEAFCNFLVADRCAKIAILASTNGCTATIPSKVRFACSI